MLVNDFGPINIDAELIVGVESNVISLANGCICCTIRDDLVETVIETIERAERPEYILLEASGVAEPSGIVMTFNNPGFRDRIRLDSILCLVDAEQVFAVPEAMELKIFQMACADMVILNKVDLVDSRQIAEIKEWLDSRFHRYRLIETSRASVPLPILLSVGHLDAGCVGAEPVPGKDTCISGHRGERQVHDHSNAFSTFSYETNRPLSLEALREVASRLPSGVYRAKGVIYAADVPERRAVLQVVGKRVDISLEAEWQARERRTRIVVIGTPEGVDRATLTREFDGCMLPSEPARAGTAGATEMAGVKPSRA